MPGYRVVTPKQVWRYVTTPIQNKNINAVRKSGIPIQDTPFLKHEPSIKVLHAFFNYFFVPVLPISTLTKVIAGVTMPFFETAPLGTPKNSFLMKRWLYMGMGNDSILDMYLY